MTLGVSLLTTLIALFTLYFLLKLYISTMQIGFISKSSHEKPDFMEGENYLKAAGYAISKERFAIIEHVVEYATFMFWFAVGIGGLDTILDTSDVYLKAVYFVLSFLLITTVVSFPLDIFKTFVLDKEYGFSTITPKLYAMDWIKSTLLTVFIASAITYLAAWIIDTFDYWWLYLFVFLMMVIIAINALYPTLMALMYNKFEPLGDEKLENDIGALLHSVGFKATGVFKVDASKRDNRLNAYFGGLGKTKRVVLFDTLLQKLSHDELLAVLGHEIGHFAHKDLLKNIASIAVVLFGMLAILGNLPDALFEEIGVFKTPATLIMMFLLVAPVLSFIAMPLINLISRHNEYQADTFGAKSSSNESLIRALLKLVEENLAFPKSHPLYIFFYYSHPPLSERLKRLGYPIDPS